MDRDRFGRKWLLSAGVAIGAVLIASPLLAILVRGLLVWTDGGPRFSFGDFGGLLADPRFRDGMANSLIAGLGTTVFSLLLGYTLAFLIVRTNIPGRRWLARANILPFFLSPYVGAIAWTWLLAPHDGLLPTYARVAYHVSLAWLEIYSLPGVIFVLTLFHTPIVYLLLITPLREMDAAFEDTARVHGASFWYTLRHVSVPMMWRTLSAAAVIVFIASAGLFDVPAALGAPRGISFVPTEIYAMSRTTADPGRAAAFAVVVVPTAFGLIAWYRWFLKSRPVLPPPARGYRQRPIRLRWPALVAALMLEAAYFTASVLLPLFALLLVSLSRHWSGRFDWRTATTVHFEYILTNVGFARTAIVNSLILAVLGSTIIVALAIGLGHALTRGDPRHRAWTNILLTPAIGLPGIVVGFGVLLLASLAPVYGTLGIVLIACVAKLLPLASRVTAARLLDINRDLEPIARTSGADWNQTMKLVVMPLLRPTLLTSWLLAFVFLIRELATPMVLYARGSETMSVALTILADRDIGYVAVLALIQMAMLLLGFLIFSLGGANLTLKSP